MNSSEAAIIACPVPPLKHKSSGPPPRKFAVINGDCKDLAIAKYVTLRRLGRAAANPRVVVLPNMNLQVAHAVTVVYAGNQAYLLDDPIRAGNARERLTREHGPGA
jgi:predicted transglutaminase-like cysteine proteinase